MLQHPFFGRYYSLSMLPLVANGLEKGFHKYDVPGERPEITHLKIVFSNKAIAKAYS